MKNKLVAHLLPFGFVALLIGGYIWSSVGATAAIPSGPVGSVQLVEGQGYGKTNWGSKYDKLVGDLVAMDEVVGTGKKSNMRLTFLDGTIMNLGEDAEITVDEMVYDPTDDSKDTVVLRLGVGAFYFVSGNVAKEKVKIITPTATIGIRGTELVIDVKEDGTTSVGVSKGHAYMTSRARSGGKTEIEVGNTARTDADGTVSDTFPGIDLTGDEEVDRNIPGVSEWLDEDKKEDDEDQQSAEFGEKKSDDGEDGQEHADRGKDDGEDGKDGEDGEDGEFAEFDNDEDEEDSGINLAEASHGEGSEGGSEGGSDGGSEGGSEGGESEGGDDGGSEGGDSEGGDGDGGSDSDGDGDGGDSDSDGGDSDSDHGDREGKA